MKKKTESPETPKYAVLYQDYAYGFGETLKFIWSCRLFTELHEAVKFADSAKGTKLFGLNPEYDFQLVSIATPK